MGLMVAAKPKEHWETIYQTKSDTGLSWYQPEPRLSLELITSVAPAPHRRILDVGGGTSTLVDKLLSLPFARLAVLDISQTALSKTRSRLGNRAAQVEWIAADITEVNDLGAFDVWHDRAVFHFLTKAADREHYVELARKSLAPGGHIIIATFADDGPTHCSGLEVRRYNAQTMAAELGQDFALVREAGETHTTPSGTSQAFFYGVFRRQ
jgi:trans-aconitate methyltransferase